MFIKYMNLLLIISVYIISYFDGCVSDRKTVTNCKDNCHLLPFKGRFNARRRLLMRSRLKAAMEAKHVVPDVVDTVPKHLVNIRYPSGVVVNLGNELTPLSVKDEPSVDWPSESDQFYTLVMTDPDVNPTDAQIKHWLVMNIPDSDVSKGEVVAPYRGSRPPLGAGIHRYIFLVYKQPGLIAHEEEVLSSDRRKGRTNFNVREFAKKYSLGEPIGANFYHAQYDEYVGQLGPT